MNEREGDIGFSVVLLLDLKSFALFFSLIQSLSSLEGAGRLTYVLIHSRGESGPVGSMSPLSQDQMRTLPFSTQNVFCFCMFKLGGKLTGLKSSLAKQLLAKQNQCMLVPSPTTHNVSPHVTAGYTFPALAKMGALLGLKLSLRLLFRGKSKS